MFHFAYAAFITAALRNRSTPRIVCGYARPDVLSECQREARRLRNGGTYNTRREEPGMSLMVQMASSIENDDGEPMNVVDYRATPESTFDQVHNTQTMP